jgi:hypothetical protein
MVYLTCLAEHHQAINASIPPAAAASDAAVRM